MGIGKEGKEAEHESEDKPEVISEPDVLPSVQHNALMTAANLDIDANENYEKLCTIELDTEEHMGKTVNKE